jgi:hypothetical protein
VRLEVSRELLRKDGERRQRGRSVLSIELCVLCGTRRCRRTGNGELKAPVARSSLAL